VSGEFERRFGQERFRVLVVANPERRLDSIRAIDAAQDSQAMPAAQPGDWRTDGSREWY
jgi:hypothetical protein